MSTMKSAQARGYGTSDFLTFDDASCTNSGGGEVHIRVSCYSVRPFDSALLADYLTMNFGHTPPWIPGTDVSGTTEELGPRVTSFNRGDRVFGCGDATRDGSYAGDSVLPAADIAIKPSLRDDLHARSIPCVTLAAQQGLYRDQTVSIHAAAGALGSLRFSSRNGAIRSVEVSRAGDSTSWPKETA